ncbi:MAG: AvaI/BsoBI family type II restriction endonuclease [Bacteroidota bacterium]
MTFHEHIRKWDDLVTKPEATRKGFIAIAFEKNIKGTPFIEEAKNLKIITAKAKQPQDLLRMIDIYPSLLTASGLSDKALGHLTDDDKKEAITELIKKFLEPAGKDFVDELIYRFLLTKGDALGGIMRNIAGSIGEKKFVRNLISTLSLKGIRFKYLHKQSKSWLDGETADTTIEENTKGLCWEINDKSRILLFNFTPPFLLKNVDMCLFDGRFTELMKNDSILVKTPKKYIALGELKGGIDPAGADEHWKTANTALDRIRITFSKRKQKPHTFFIGAAIEKSMSQEIFSQLKSRRLTNAANLTVDSQLVSICNWICSL